MSAFFENEELFELRVKFIQSAKEKAESIEVLILKAESQKSRAASKALLKEILSISHTIKNSSRVYKFDAIALICHKLEDYISELLDHEKIVSAEELTKMLRHIDLLASYFKEFIYNKTVDDKKYQDEYRKQFMISTPTIGDDPQKTVTVSSKAQILIVGINKTIMKQVYAGLESINCTVSFATDALEALHRLSLEKFDLVISSYIMDPIDGVSFTLAAKNQWQKKAPKVILLSSELIEFPYEKDVSPDKVVVKSLNLPTDLKKFLEHEYPQFIKNRSTAKKSVRHHIQSIYFVEDDQNILELFMMVFNSKKDVALFNDVTKSDPYHQLIMMRPDLIICDIHVPNVDIVGLLVKIKTSEELSRTPVVFFTGDPHQPLAAKLLHLGALAVLDKTIILSSMFEELEKLGLDLNTNA